MSVKLIVRDDVQLTVDGVKTYVLRLVAPHLRPTCAT